MVWRDQDKLIWFRWCQACVAATRWGVQRQVCRAYSQAWWWECHGLGLHECCRHWGATVHWVHDILKQRLGRRAVFQNDNDPKHTSKTTTALLKKLRVKVMDWPSMSPDLNPIEHLWGILKRKVEERKVSNIQQLLDVVLEEWKRTPVATCGALVATQNIDTLGPIWTFLLRGVLTFVASGLDINGCVLSYFEGTANLHCYTSCTLTTLHCSKVSFLQCCHMKRYNKIFTKMWGVYSLLWDTVCQLDSIPKDKNVYQECTGWIHLLNVLYIKHCEQSVPLEV